MLTSRIGIDMCGGEMNTCNVVGRCIDATTRQFECEFDTLFPLVFVVETCKGVITINHLLTCALDILDGITIEQLLDETKFEFIGSLIIGCENLHLTVVGSKLSQSPKNCSRGSTNLQFLARCILETLRFTPVQFDLLDMGLAKNAKKGHSASPLPESS